MSRVLSLLCAGLSALACVAADGEPLKLSALFTDGMVIAENRPVRVFGTGCGAVRVSFRGHEVQSTATGGPWCVELPAGAAGGPYELRVSLDGREQVVRDVRVGLVILFAGQSNMQFKLRESAAPADRWCGDSRIRSFSTEMVEAGEPFAPSNGWVVLTRENAGRWSAIAYETATRLAAARNVAVGVVNCYQGASTIQAWMDPAESARPCYRIPEGGALYGDHFAPRYVQWNQPPGTLYRRQFGALVPYAFSGVAWYQGESNTGRREAETYAALLEALMRGWRADLRDAELPFVIVQLADFDYRNDGDWKAVQAAQAVAALRDPHAWLVRAADVCESHEIHPKSKDRLSARIADALLSAGSSASGARLPMVPQPRLWQAAGGCAKVDPARAAYAIAPDDALGGEGYELTIAADGGVRATAPTEQGLAWARRTVDQLSRADQVPVGTMRDWPKYRVRGVMLDVGRKFVRLETLRAMLKDLAYYKMNEFHIHLNDDGAHQFVGEKGYSAFRLECETYPGLTAPDGFYTKAEFRAFMKEAAALGVTVIPEIDTPAHSGAFIRYCPELEGTYGRTHLALDKPAVRDFIEKLFAEYLDGPDPVFAGKYVHVGTDEYDKREAENFRAYTDWAFKMVRRHGHEPRAWGALDHAAGRAPVVADEKIVMDIWHNPYYDPFHALKAGYSIVAIPDFNLYIVPAAGYYFDYLDVEGLFRDWEPCVFADRTVPADHPRLLGGKFAVWNDLAGNGISEDDIIDRMLHAVPTLAEKMWTGKAEGLDWSAFKAIADRVGEAPGVNLADRPTGPNGTPGPDDAALGWTDGGWKVEFDLTLASVVCDVVLFDDGTSQVKVFKGGHPGFSRDGYDWSAEVSLVPGRTYRMAFFGDAVGVSLLVDGKRVGDTHGLKQTCRDFGGKPKDYRVVRTLHFPLRSVVPSGVTVSNFSARTLPLPEWPFAILRNYGSYEANTNFLGRVFAAQERHPGLVDEIWFAGVKGDIFGDPDQMGAGAAELSLAAKPICEKLGIAFSYQQGVTLNHDPDDRPHPGIPDDAWVVDREGRVRKGLFCCTSPFALDFSYRKAKSILAAIRPASYWPDDDLRILKVDWSKPGICFCPRCLALFGERQGKTYTRESLLSELDPGSPKANPLTRENWCAFNAEKLAAYAQTFRRAADEVSPETRLGIQAACSRFAANGDLMPRILETFAGLDGKAGIRPGGGYYSDFDGRDGLIAKMLDVSRDAARAGKMLQKGQVCYECENWPHVGAIKSPGGMMAECALALGFGCDSIAFYWGADQNGESPESYDFWLETMNRWRPFHLAVRDAFRGMSLGGVAVFHGSAHFATDEWYNHDDDNLTRLARNALPVSVAEAQPEVLMLDERGVRTLATNDLAKVFAWPTLMDTAAFEALGRRFPELKFTRKLKVTALAGERALSTSVRASGYEKFAAYGKCEKVRALLYPQAEDVVRFSEMTADPQACGTCVVPTEFGGKAVVVQDIDGKWPHVCWPGCRRRAILDALDLAVPGGMPARVLTDGYALSLVVRKDLCWQTAGVLVTNLGSGETPPLELALRRGVTEDWSVRLPCEEPARAEIVRRSEREIVVRLPPLRAFQPALVSPQLPRFSPQGN